MWVQEGSGITVDNNTIIKRPCGWSGDEDKVVYLENEYGSWTWANTRFYNNYVSIPRVTGGNGIGDDGFRVSGRGIDINNNTIVSVGYDWNQFTEDYGQHNDGFQTMGGEYIRVFDNYFANFAGYPIFWDCFYGFNQCMTYNNIIVFTESGVASGPPQGIASGTDGGAYDYTGEWPTISHFYIFNNLVADYGGHACINHNSMEGTGTVTIDNMIVNNVCVNGGGYGIDDLPGITQYNNASITSAAAPNTFTAYSFLSGSNDFHLKSSDTVLKDKGTNLSSYFTTDYDGNSRAGTWDIGPYNDSSAPVPDTTAPVVTVQAPTGTVACTSNPMVLSEIITTNEAATARWGTSNAAYSSLPGTFTTTGGTTHSRSTARACGASYTVYVAAMDGSGNASATQAMSYTIAAADAPPEPSEEFITGTRFGENSAATVQTVTTDMYVSAFNPDFSFDTAANGFVRTSPADTAGRALLLKFALTSIPANATVQAAKLYLYQNESGGGSNLYVSTHKVTGTAWTTDSTWNTYAWSGQIAAAEDEVALGLSSGWKAWTVTSMVAGWVATPASNKGMVVTTDQGSNHAAVDTYRGFALSENGDATLRPMLIVQYVLPAPGDKVLQLKGGTLTLTPGGGTLTFTVRQE
jgi:hypothetical protein